MQDKIFNMLLHEDDVTWQTIIQDLIKRNEMNPWDVDVSVLTQKYIEIIKQLKEMDFRVSGKVLLAAAILLKIKSNKLVGDDMMELDRMLYAEDEITDSDFYEDLEDHYHMKIGRLTEMPPLIPRTPQPRKRKVSVYDLINALEKALEVKRRRVMRSAPGDVMQMPVKAVDVGELIKKIYAKIKVYFSSGDGTVTFSRLLPSPAARMDKILTFIPLLHLATQRKIDLWQKEHFGEIEIMMARSLAKQKVEAEL